MKKMLFLVVMAIAVSCDDGDIQVESIDFDSVDLEYCDTATINTELFFKINGDETLILELESGFLENAVTTEDKTSDLSSASTLTYRIFSDDVSSTYFCATVPATSPTVITEIVAKSGTLTLSTAQDTTDLTKFTHTLTLSDITFQEDSGSRLTDLTISEFGEVITYQE